VIALLPEDEEQDPAATKVLAFIPEKGPQAEDIDLNVAVTIWNAGHNSVGKLMRMFRLTNHQAQKLRKMILTQAGAQPEEVAD